MFGVEFNSNQKLAILVLFGLAVIGLSSAHLSRAPLRTSNEISIEEPGSDGATVTADDSDSMPHTAAIRNAGKVVCHVAGCVKNPGVYTLQYGERVIDAIGAAGGPTADANMQALNLAAKVEDGSKIEVCSLRDTAAVAPLAAGKATFASARRSSEGSSSGSGEKLRVPGEGLVRINSADIEELQRLPGVGPATAEKIVDYRKAIRKFTSPEQLMDVKGIGPKTFEKMRPFVAL